MNIKRFERYICIFCIVIGFLAAYVIGYRIGNDKGANVILKEEIRNEKPYISSENTVNNSTEVVEKSIILKEDAVLVIETCREENKNDMETTRLKLPIEMIGLDRKALVEYLEENGDSFKEESEEIDSLMLISFSPEQVVVRKNVHEGQVIIYTNEDSEKYNYYIAFDNEKVIVYKKDKTTVFIETGITFDMLEKDIREKIEKGVWIENISVLYRYLESITS